MAFPKLSSIGSFTCDLNDIEYEALCRVLNSISKAKVIFNNETTILYVGKRKYVCTAKNAPFDEEKGVLMCAMKAKYQIKNYTELRKLIDNAKRYGTARK